MGAGPSNGAGASTITDAVGNAVIRESERELAEDQSTRTRIEDVLESTRNDILVRVPESVPERDSVPENVPEIETLVNEVLEQIDSGTRDSGTLSGTGWRVEVTNNGRYYTWRRGRGKNRESRTGGKFSDLSADRQAAYYKNREERARHKREARDTTASDTGLSERRG